MCVMLHVQKGLREVTDQYESASALVSGRGETRIEL